MVVSSLDQIGVPRIIQGEPLELWLERELARAEEHAQTAREFEAHRLQAMAHWHDQTQSDCIRVDRSRNLLEDNPSSG